MKQQITWDQFIELSYEQVSELQELVGQKYHLIESAEHWEEVKNHKHTFADGATSKIHTSYAGIIEKTTIGKMIEILRKKKVPLTIRLVFNGDGVPEYIGQQRNDFENLCDELWEEIKEAPLEEEIKGGFSLSEKTISQIAVITKEEISKSQVGVDGVAKIIDKTIEGENGIDFIFEVYNEKGQLIKEIINCPVEIIY